MITRSGGKWVINRFTVTFQIGYNCRAVGIFLCKMIPTTIIVICTHIRLELSIKSSQTKITIF